MPVCENNLEFKQGNVRTSAPATAAFNIFDTKNLLVTSQSRSFPLRPNRRCVNFAGPLIRICWKAFALSCYDKHSACVLNLNAGQKELVQTSKLLRSYKTALLRFDWLKKKWHVFAAYFETCFI